MAITIKRIQFRSGKRIPENTRCKITMTDTAGAFAVELQLPGQSSATHYENLGVEDECLTIPVTSTFLSHVKEDRDFVNGIATRLLSDGVLTWFDEKDLLPGEAWKLKIDRAIQNSDYFLTFLSNRSVSKIGYFQRELRYALEQQDLRPHGAIFIIPVLLDNCEPPVSLNDIQWLHTTQADWYSKLKSVITSLPK